MNDARPTWPMTAVSALAAIGFVCAVLALFRHAPVAFTFLVTEDYWAEYGTAAAFAIAGIVSIALALTGEGGVRRFAWLAIGLALLVVGAEEVSWGQRILGLDVPDSWEAHNVQGELTLHNLESAGAFNSALHRKLSFALFIWCSVSLWAIARGGASLRRLEAIGFPLAPVHIAPLACVALFFLLTNPVPNADEIGELVLALCVLSWTSGCLAERLDRGRAAPRTMMRLGVAAAMTIAVVAGSAGITAARPGSPAGYLNRMAREGYPSRGMYAQAHEVFEFIYRNPRWIRPETRIVHAEQLLAVGETARASELLDRELTALDARWTTEGDRGRFWRHLAIVLNLAGEGDRATDAIARALELDLARLDTASGGDPLARALLSISRTLTVAGDAEGAQANARRALSHANAAQLRTEISTWIEDLETPSRSGSPASLLR